MRAGSQLKAHKPPRQAGIITKSDDPPVARRLDLRLRDAEAVAGCVR
jgi:hypothetical protein